MVGGYNSSNTTNIVKISQEEIETYFIDSADRIISESEITHFHLPKQAVVLSNDYLPTKYPVEILLTSGASCPDAIVEAVIRKIVSFFKNAKDVDSVVNDLLEEV